MQGRYATSLDPSFHRMFTLTANLQLEPSAGMSCRGEGLRVRNVNI